MRAPDFFLTGKTREVFESDFDLSFYRAETLDIQTLEEQVRAFFGEKLMKPRGERLWIGRDGTLDPDYEQMMKRSIDYWRGKGDLKAVTRFEKELEGAQNAVKLVLGTSEGKRPLPIILNASDPGDFYVDKDGKKKSVTFLWMLESEEENGWHYRVYSIPTKFIGVTEHWQLLKRLGELQLTVNILDLILLDLDANSLIAYPVILDKLNHTEDEVAQELGYDSWREIEEIAADQLALESDPMAHERRETIVSEFTMRIFFAVKEGRSREYQKALVAAMSDTMALEAGKRNYLHMSALEIKEEIDKNVRLALALEYKVFEKKSYDDIQHLGINFGNLSALFVHNAWMQNAFYSNPLAQEARSTGCGGSGMGYLYDNNGDLSQPYSFGFEYDKTRDLFEQQRILYESGNRDNLNDSGEEPEGRYKEGKYKPGHCKACDTDRQKVWHKEDGGCDCCTKCERRLAGGE